MVTSVRITAIGDTPDGVKAHFDEVLRRVGLGIGTVTEEVIQRRTRETLIPEQTLTGETPLGIGYEGRMKVVWDAPMNFEMQSIWDRGGDPFADLKCSDYSGTAPHIAS